MLVYVSLFLVSDGLETTFVMLVYVSLFLVSDGLLC